MANSFPKGVVCLAAVGGIQTVSLGVLGKRIGVSMTGEDTDDTGVSVTSVSPNPRPDNLNPNWVGTTNTKGKLHEFDLHGSKCPPLPEGYSGDSEKWEINFAKDLLKKESDAITPIVDKMFQQTLQLASGLATQRLEARASEGGDSHYFKRTVPSQRQKICEQAAKGAIFKVEDSKVEDRKVQWTQEHCKDNEIAWQTMLLRAEIEAAVGMIDKLARLPLLKQPLKKEDDAKKLTVTWLEQAKARLDSYSGLVFKNVETLHTAVMQRFAKELDDALERAVAEGWSGRVKLDFLYDFLHDRTLTGVFDYLNRQGRTDPGNSSGLLVLNLPFTLNLDFLEECRKLYELNWGNPSIFPPMHVAVAMRETAWVHLGFSRSEDDQMVWDGSRGNRDQQSGVYSKQFVELVKGTSWAFPDDEKASFIQDDRRTLDAVGSGRDWVQFKEASLFGRYAAHCNLRAIVNPSGTTHTFMRLAKILGFHKDDLFALRNALITYMVLRQDHSFYEIVLAAHEFMAEEHKCKLKEHANGQVCGISV